MKYYWDNLHTSQKLLGLSWTITAYIKPTATNHVTGKK